MARSLGRSGARRRGAPEIVNTDQGCQYTSAAWTGAVEALGAQVSMDGKGRWVDNVFIERLWSSLKCEDISLRDDCDLAIKALTPFPGGLYVVTQGT